MSFIPDKTPTSEHSISNIECTHEEVYRLLSSYKTNTASGPDGISSQMIRGTATAISPAITKIFNLSLKQSRVPDLWKVSNVTPIPEDGDPTSPCNYHPISLLSLISKVLERIVHTKMSKFLFSNKSCQTVNLDSGHGPPPKKPCFLSLMTGINYLKNTTK